ncbi:MAG: hypothetical protein PQJ46_13695 [Spirochaetales bacterium]|nr:hypothetical protein [Spirochaetales bacterium]
MKKLDKFYFCLILFLLVSSMLYSYPDSEYDLPVFKGDFFVLMEPSDSIDVSIYDEPTAIKQVLHEAQYVFSGMIYGFKFVYIPKDNSRGIEEEFTVEPVYSIPWGDEGLSAATSYYKDGRYQASVRYKVRAEQLPWIASWETNMLASTGGTGDARLYSGYEGKIEAINDSIKGAIRNYLRPRIYNKPRRIKGTVRLNEVPYIIVDSGKYICQSKVTFRFDEILEYQHY